MTGKDKSNKQSNKKYSYKALRTAIERQEIEKIKEIFVAAPKLIICPQPNEDGLKYACVLGKTASAQQLLKLMAKENNPQSDKLISDNIVESIRFEKLDMVKVFVNCGFDLNYVISQKKSVAFTCIDFAILGGHYEIAYYIYNRIDPRLKNLRNVKEYELLGKEYLYRYVNYQMFVEGLVNNTKPSDIGNYLKKQLSQKRKQQIRRMHHEGCWEWLMRMICVKNKGKKQQTTKIDPNPEKVETSRKLTNPSTK